MSEETQKTEGGEVMTGDTSGVVESLARFSFERYASAAIGGRIDKENYDRVMKRAWEESQAGVPLKESAKDQTNTILGISPGDMLAIEAETGIDPRRIYGILREREASNKDAIEVSQGTEPSYFEGLLGKLRGESAKQAAFEAARPAHHHSQMSDQLLLVEALRMLEQGDVAKKVIDAHPHISFS